MEKDIAKLMILSIIHNFFPQDINKKGLLKASILSLVINTQIIKVFTIASPIVDVVFQGLLFLLCITDIKFMRKRNIFFPLMFVCIFFIGIVSGIYTPDNNRLMSVVKFFVICLTSLSVCTFTIAEIKLVLKYALLINLIYSFFVIFDKIPPNDFNYLNLTLSLGCCCSIIVSELFFNKLNLVTLTLFGIFIIALFNFVARGPIIFLALQCVLLCLIVQNHRKRNLILLTIFVSAMLVYLYVIPHTSYDLGYRFLVMEANEHIEAGSRDFIISKTLEAINQSWILGYGINASKDVTGCIYPHNYLLQLWLEFGLIPLIFIILGTIITYYKAVIKILNSKNDSLLLTLLCCLSYYEFQFLKSFDLLSSYPLWIFFILTLNTTESKYDNIHIRHSAQKFT